MPKNSRYSLLVVLVFLVVVSLVFRMDFAGAATVLPPYLSGYAWSSNIGWISFSSAGASPSYGVTYDSNTGLLSGYAWSNNMGWVSFGCGQSDGAGGVLCSETTSPPNYPSGGGVVRSGPTFDSTSNRFVGFARACSVFASGCSGPLKSALELGGWDGWISLTGETSEATPNQYGIWLDLATNKLSGFAWGGGDEPDITGENKSPQFPGWINFTTAGGDGTGTCFDNIRNGDETSPDSGGRCGSGPVGGGDGTCFDNKLNGDETAPDFGGRCGTSGPVGDGTGTCFDNIQNGNESSPDAGGRCGPEGPGVEMCATPTCGAAPTTGVECTRAPFPIVNNAGDPNRDTVWTASVPSDPGGSYTYLWKINRPATDYTLISGPASLNTNSITIRYKTPGPWTANDLNVEVTGGAIFGTAKCQAGITDYIVGDKDFEINHTGNMTARFIRSIRTVTFPDVTITVTPAGDFTAPVTLGFAYIENANGIRVAGNGSNDALLVTPVFNPGATVSDPYQPVTLRLNITKNQNAGDLPLPSGNYRAFISGSGDGIYKEHPIDLRIDNPSGGVIER